MDMLERVIGGPKQQTEYRDFIDRFDRGSPYDSIDDQEAVDRYQRVTPELSRTEYRESAEGGTGGPLDNPIAKVALAGIAAMAAQRLLGGRR